MSCDLTRGSKCTNACTIMLHVTARLRAIACGLAFNGGCLHKTNKKASLVTPPSDSPGGNNALNPLAKTTTVERSPYGAHVLLASIYAHAMGYSPALIRRRDTQHLNTKEEMHVHSKGVAHLMSLNFHDFSAAPAFCRRAL